MAVETFIEDSFSSQTLQLPSWFVNTHFQSYRNKADWKHATLRSHPLTFSHQTTTAFLSYSADTIPRAPTQGFQRLILNHVCRSLRYLFRSPPRHESNVGQGRSSPCKFSYTHSDLRGYSNIGNWMFRGIDNHREMASLTSFVRYMDLEHFLFWIVITLPTRMGFRNFTGTDNMHGRLSSSPPQLRTRQNNREIPRSLQTNLHEYPQEVKKLQA